MKTKEAVSIKKQSVTVKDLKTKKNPKGGGGPIAGVDVNIPPKGARHMYIGTVTLVK